MVILMILVFLGMAAPPGGAQAGRIVLVPVGPAGAGVLSHLASGLNRELMAPVITAAATAVPEGAYAPERRQYLAEDFLPGLTPYRQSGAELVLGITPVDLYVPGLNFVFGLADPRHKTAVISLARLDPQFYGLPQDAPLLHKRALKEAVHELGHCLGLAHCPDPTCIMFFSNSLADTDHKGPGFCPRCRQRLEER
jgi:archaemetzincin